jgi:pilus assembly protein CpaB
MGVRRSADDEENESSVNPETTAIDNPALATFALRPEEILELVAASRLGEIYLMLRPLVPQSDYVTGAEYTMKSLKAKRIEQETPNTVLEEPESENKNEPVTPPPVEEKIEIIYGDK